MRLLLAALPVHLSESRAAPGLRHAVARSSMPLPVAMPVFLSLNVVSQLDLWLHP